MIHSKVGKDDNEFRENHDDINVRLHLQEGRNCFCPLRKLVVRSGKTVSHWMNCKQEQEATNCLPKRTRTKTNTKSTEIKGLSHFWALLKIIFPLESATENKPHNSNFPVCSPCTCAKKNWSLLYSEEKTKKVLLD